MSIPEMYNDNILSEDASVTGLKYVLLMFVGLILIEWPMLQITVGAQLNVMSAILNGLATATSQH
jgi:hypothetical protein